MSLGLAGDTWCQYEVLCGSGVVLASVKMITYFFYLLDLEHFTNRFLHFHEMMLTDRKSLQLLWRTFSGCRLVADLFPDFLAS